MTDRPSLWQILWDHDSNGLVVVNPDLHVTLVESIFSPLFKRMDMRTVVC